MRTMIQRVVVLVLLVLLGRFTAVAQLPPEVQADAYMMQVEQAFDDGDYDLAWARLQDILRLQADNDVDLPEFRYWHAKAAGAMNMPEQALESVTEYLTASGRDARHYVEALELLNTLQAAVTCDGWNAGAYFETATPEQVTACLETGNIDLDAPNAAGLAPLHSAAAHAQDPAVIQVLLAAGAQVEASDPVSGATPLSLAIRDNGNPAIIEVLLAAGANPGTPNSSGLTPLHLAAVHTDDPAVFEVLLKAGSDVTTPEQVLESTGRSIEILIGAGADPAHLDQALESVMTDLAGTGVDVSNDATAQALMNTVQAAVLCEGWNTTGYFETAMPDQVAECLATNTVDLTARGATGLTPLQAAAVDAQTPDMIEALLVAGADPTATNSRFESGRLEWGDTVRSNGAYQDSYTFGLAKGVVVEVRSNDFDIYLIVESPSGSRFVNDDYQGNERWSRLSLTLDEVGEYQVLVSSYSARESGTYSLEIRTNAAVHLAAQYNENPAVLAVFLNAGLDPNEKREDGTTLLHLAAQSNPNPAVIETLLAAGANVQEDDENGRRPLHYAALNETPVVLEALLAAGADLEEDDDREYTPLHYAACCNENPAVVQFLIDAGANLEEDAGNDGLRVLHLAASGNENPAVLEALLAAGADLEKDDDREYTPLHYAACCNENPAVIQFLIDAGANLEEDAGNYGLRALHLAAQDNENPVVLEALLATGANLERALRLAARGNENPAVIQTLLAAGADLEEDTNDEWTPLHYAARYNENPAVIQTLLAAGAEIEARTNYGLMPLHLAAAGNENPAVLEALLAAGANVNEDDEFSRTPLHRAARGNENPAVVEALLTAGADFEAVDEDGRTPLYYATDENDNPAVREALLQAGAGQTETQRAATQADSGPGLFGAAVGILGGAAIAAAGEGSEEALQAGADFAEMVIGGETPAGGAATGAAGASTGDLGAGASGGQCQIPGYPSPPGGVASLGLSWCPASVGFQVRAFALQAAGAQCAIATGSSSTPQQIQARRREIAASCGRLAAMGVSNCQCPASYRP